MKACIRWLLLFLFVAYAPQPVIAETSSTCTPSKLTDDDARILLYVTPIAVYTRKNGTDVDIEKSGEIKGYPAADNFIAVLISQKPADTPLNNGIVGYFAVNRNTGVVESLADFTEVSGSELTRVQEWIRHGHCIHAKDSQDGK